MLYATLEIRTNYGIMPIYTIKRATVCGSVCAAT